MSDTYLVKSSTLDSEVKFGDDRMNKFVLDLEDANGQVVNGVEHWLKVGKEPFLEGDTITGEIKQAGPDRLKLARGRKADGSGGGSPSGSTGSSGASSNGDSSSYRSPEEIKRTTAQGHAIRFIDATGNAEDLNVLEGEIRDAYLREAVKPIIDFFYEDLKENAR